MKIPLRVQYIERDGLGGSYSYIIKDSINHTIAEIVMDSQASQSEKLVMANKIVHACNTIKICESKLANERHKKEALLSAAKGALTAIQGIMAIMATLFDQEQAHPTEEKILVKAIEFAEKEE